MNRETKAKLINIAIKNIQRDTSLHEIDHAMRVLKHAEYIASKEGGDLDIIIPSALFHDVIWYPKDHPKSKFAPYESAGFAIDILNKLSEFPKDKIPMVYTAIKQCSLTKYVMPDFLEGKILQDADRLDATGAISIARNISSPLEVSSNLISLRQDSLERKETISMNFELDVFYTSLVKIKDLMHTPTGITLAEKRAKALKKYLLYMN